MSRIYRWQAKATGTVYMKKGSLHADLDAAILDTLVSATWIAWFKGTDAGEWQPTLMEAERDEDGATSDWTEIPTDDPRVLAFFDGPDVDSLEESIVSRLRGYPYWLNEDRAGEALEQVEQYDGYRVQSLVSNGRAVAS